MFFCVCVWGEGVQVKKEKRLPFQFTYYLSQENKSVLILTTTKMSLQKK